MKTELMYYKGVDIFEYFHLVVNIFNLEEKLKFKLSGMHPYKKKALEMEHDLTNAGLDTDDFMAIDNKAKEYIEEHR